MDEKIDKVIELVGNKNRYQYFTLIIMVLLWINCNIIAIIITYIEREPKINYIKNGKTYNNEILTNELCSDIGEGNYEIKESFEYSWVSEFNIECNKVEIGFIGSFAFIGNTAGGLIFSIINKFLSHKKILIISSFGFCIFVFLCTLVKSHTYFYFLLFCEIFIGLFGNCLCYSSLVIAQEIVSNEKRSLFSSIINVGYSLCGILYSIAFYLAQDWRKVFYILIISSFITLLLIWIFVYDSPREYINKKDYRNTISILEGIASINGKLTEFRESIKLDEYQDFLNELKGEKDDNNENNEDNEDNKNNEYNEIADNIDKILLDENKEKKQEENNDYIPDDKNINLESNYNINDDLLNDEEQNEKKFKIQKITFASLFKYPSIRYKFIILNFLWIGTRLSFNGISISSKSFKGNFYVNIILLYIIESISYCVCGCLIDIKKLGRKGTLWIQYILIIITFFILAFINLGTVSSLVLNFIARFCASGIDVIFYTYTIEIYPTPIRSIAFGVNATFGNAGSILAPMLLEFLPNWLFLIILAGICGLNSFFIMFLPETVGKPMIESIEELSYNN